MQRAWLLLVIPALLGKKTHGEQRRYEKEHQPKPVIAHHRLHREINAARPGSRELEHRQVKQMPGHHQKDGEHDVTDGRKKISAEFTAHEAQR